MSENNHATEHLASENGHTEVEELHRRVSELEDENSRLRDQMLQANLYELQQRRECDALREELSQLRASQ